MHIHLIERNGDVVDLIPFCSDTCHRKYCADNMLTYDGWNGCNEGGDGVDFCAQCGVVAGGDYECEHQRDNIVVNRFVCDDGEKCECGCWIQLPRRMIR